MGNNFFKYICPKQLNQGILLVIKVVSLQHFSDKEHRRWTFGEKLQKHKADEW